MASNNSDNSGYYQPPRKPFKPLPNYEEQVNRTKGWMSPQIIDGINNLINMMPSRYAEQLNIGGENIIWLRRKISGPRCPFIFDNNEEQCPVSKCPKCFGTTFLGGYDNGIKIMMSFNPQRQEIKTEQAGLNINQSPMAWTLDTDPIIKPYDIIVTQFNIRYIIASQETEEKQGKRMYQRLTLTKPDVYDVVYDIPVPGMFAGAQTDFRARIKINGLHQDFIAGIFINNFYWSPTGQNNFPLNG